MSQPGYGAPTPGERWNVNMPAVIGVVFVFLLGVVIWVIATSGGGDDSDVATGDQGTAATTIVAPVTSGAVTTTPAPMPSTSQPAATAPPTSESTTTTAATTTAPSTTSAPVTTAAGAGSGAVAGDLAVPGRPMQSPPCDGSYITVLASAIGDQATAGGIATVLDAYPGSNYLRTDQTCPSLTPDIDGQPIYVVFFGPFAFASDACAARSGGPEGAYGRQLSTDVGPNHSVACP